MTFKLNNVKKNHVAADDLLRVFSGIKTVTVCSCTSDQSSHLRHNLPVANESNPN